MSLSKNILIDKIEIIENEILQIRERTDIVEDGQILSSSYHRWVLNPGDELADQDPRVQAIAQALWTEEVINALAQAATAASGGAASATSESLDRHQINELFGITGNKNQLE